MDKFVNRNSERARFLNLLHFTNDRNRCVIVIGASGVGKSKLTQHIIRNYANEVPAFKVEFKNAISNNYGDGSYLREVAKNIHCNSTTFGMKSLGVFIKQLSSRQIKNNILHSVRQEFIDKLPIGKTIVKEYTDALFNDGKFNCESILNSYNAEPYSLMKDYIIYIFKTYKLILNIENVQNIDPSSLYDIATAFAQSKKSLLILEYTPADTVSYSLSEIIDFIENLNIDTEVMNIEPLSLNDVKEIIDNHPEVSWELIQNSVVNWNGNLKSIIDLITRMKYDSSYFKTHQVNLKSNYTEELINQLDTISKQILVLFTEHVDPVDSFIVRELASNIEYRRKIYGINDIAKTLEKLEKYKLINKDILGNRYLLNHDSIISIIQSNNQYLKFRLIAKTVWYDLYKSESITSYVSRSVRLSRILYFASKLEYDNVIVSYLNSIYNEALKCKHPESLIEYVLVVRSKLKRDSKSRMKIDIWLICLYYNLAHSRKAIEIIEDTDATSPLITLITILVLEDLGEKHRALELCNDELKFNNQFNVNYDLALRSTRLMINYVIGNHEQALEEYKSIYGNPRYMNLFEYGFLLRNAELIYSDSSFKESLPPIWESVKHFQKFKAVKMEAYSRITYGVQIALIGNFNKALTQFSIAEKLLLNVVTERHTVLNNISVVNLYQENYSDEIKMLLNQAINLSQREFDTVAIHLNYLALLDWRNENDEAEKLISTLLKFINCRTFSSVELVAGCYFNIYKYYEKMQQNELAHNYKILLLELPLTINAIWKYRLYGNILERNENDYIESTVNRYLSFISNWNLEVDNILMQYE